MKLIACLGNPGKKYARNRHNAGFRTGEYLSSKYGIAITEKKFSSHCGSGIINQQKVILILPQTYMNQSGIAVKAAMEYYDIPPDGFIAIHDDIELPFADVRYKFGGGHKGQNGIRSIVDNLETPDFHRIRIGVGRPENQEMTVADYLLSNFSEEEFQRMPEIFLKAEKILLEILQTGEQN